MPLANYIFKRILISIPTLLAITILSFSIIHLAPGSPAANLLGEKAFDKTAVRQLEENLGLNKPLPEQYLHWISAILQGDLGTSIGIKQGAAVADLFAERIGPTLLLTLSAFLLAISIGIPLGIFSALKHNSAFDRLATFFSFIGISMPGFWFGLMLILIFSVTFGILPSSGIIDPRIESPTLLDYLSHLIMPASVLAFGEIAVLSRYARAGMLDVMKQDFVRTARAKGLDSKTIILNHQLRNSLLTLITIFGASIPGLLGGAVLTETVFGWPGMGRLSVNAIFSRDYPVIMADVLIFGFLTVLGNLLADIFYAIADPRIKYEGGK